MKKRLNDFKGSKTTARLRQLIDRAIGRMRDSLSAPGPQLQPIPVRVKRRKG